jgi:hypothetical protein
VLADKPLPEQTPPPAKKFGASGRSAVFRNRRLLVMLGQVTGVKVKDFTSSVS